MYNIGISIYSFLFGLVALFHKKASKMVKGHKDAWSILDDKIDNNRKWLWFHAASLGEFEQGRPIIEKIRASGKDYAILVTFYSPSGYEVRKNYSGADIVCYLPFDKKSNVKKFVEKVNPAMAFFIKYEFWPNYLKELQGRKIPTYLISGVFREDQAFFKPLYKSYSSLLNAFTHFFVQDQNSVDLLRSIGYAVNVSICGDTRYDRVIEICDNSKKLDLFETFRADNAAFGNKILIAGSSWPKDELLILPYFNARKDLKLIIAPHEIHEEHLKSIEAQLTRPYIRYSQAGKDDINKYDCVIIDCFGLLSSIYRYGDIAYIGGGFGVGIHNTLEAAVYGIPVIFGPNFGKFIEAKELISCGGGFTIKDENEYKGLMDRFFASQSDLSETGNKAGEMVRKGAGGTDKIIEFLDL